MVNSSNAVIVAIIEKHNDYGESIEEIYYWDGITIKTTTQSISADDILPLSVDATEEQIQDAGDWYQIHSGDTSNGTYIGCTVILKGSRKAPNAKPLLVVDYVNSFCNGRYVQRIPAKVVVMVGNEYVRAPVTCVAKLVTSPRPFWACRD